MRITSSSSERARTEWLRHGGNGRPGVSQQRIAEDFGLMFVVRSTQVDYRRPARLDDTIRIVSRVERAGRVGIDFHQDAFVAPAGGGAEQLVAVGRIKVACVTRDGLRPAQIPEALRAIFAPA